MKAMLTVEPTLLCSKLGHVQSFAEHLDGQGLCVLKCCFSLLVLLLQVGHSGLQDRDSTEEEKMLLLAMVLEDEENLGGEVIFTKPALRLFNTEPKLRYALAQQTTTVLLKLIENVIQNPTNPKFRRIRLANPTVANKLLSAIGAMECLFEVGFQEGEDYLVLPNETSIESLTNFRNEVLQRKKVFLQQLESQTSGPTSYSSLQGVSTSSHHSASLPPSPPRHQPLLQSSPPGGRAPVQTNVKPPFFQRMSHFYMQVLQYEDKALQQKALSLIPVKDLEGKAECRMRSMQQAIKKDSKAGKTSDSAQEVDATDILLVQLLDWFKNSFFKWVDKPPCVTCQGPTTHIANTMEDGLRVEVYRCGVCTATTRFHRYNDVGKLLETKCGRCGEWANCFTLLCRAMGWDARFIVDEGDHVWTEVYSATQKRWLHCDPCENVCDAPLMYETGWGKKLSYVIAYSCDEVQDVSWRYSCDHAGILARRTQCTEEDLLRLMLAMREERQHILSPARKAYINRRLVLELVEFFTQKKPTDIDYQGRSSGSLSWRLARDETRDEAVFTPHTWRPTAPELEAREMHIRYSTAQDKYVQGTLNQQVERLGWRNGAHLVSKVFRKEETDWKMVYVARKESSNEGIIEWKFDLSGTGYLIDSVNIVSTDQCYKTGAGTKTCTDFVGESSVTLMAKLKGGVGDLAWQHAQLFRQSSDSREFSFVVNIKLISPKPNS
uniref:Peptide-N(4)-(N-acetyl-beta-glucosaminyl)asparagine amidase n=1 Tax=Timema californicum TaxID=61474 RepID=A0A7R9J866_TIMCA|nr:unnamed protein product [Timema californicum]